MNGKNPYAVLGLSHNATEEEVREAYRKMVRQYHPDQFQDARAKELAEAKMREINWAYDEITLGRVRTTSFGGGESASRQTPPPYGQQSPYGAPYQHPSGSPYYRSTGSGPSCCQTMSCLCCADTCCECFGGDLCRCC